MSDLRERLARFANRRGLHVVDMGVAPEASRPTGGGDVPPPSDASSRREVALLSTGMVVVDLTSKPDARARALAEWLKAVFGPDKRSLTDEDWLSLAENALGDVTAVEPGSLYGDTTVIDAASWAAGEDAEVEALRRRWVRMSDEERWEMMREQLRGRV